MKFLILFLISLPSFAGYMTVSDLAKCMNDPNSVYTVHSSMRTCKSNCKEVPKGFSCDTHSEQDTQVDDLKSPKYTKAEIEACSGQLDCETKLAAKECTDIEESRLIDKDYTEVYCSKFNGYNKKTIKKYREDSVKKSAYNASEDAKKSAKDSMKSEALILANKVRLNNPLTADERDKLLKYLLRNLK